ncbi:hypothetical protein I546_1468 [Mycobacterium kansasii 732]|uniref:Uncharacterized protein n=1 Tax=Mycobacterium kansasii 662 TaxID=1299326 RepID=X7Z325_MYCKA|nr:hypothetical protein I545_4840 [Mycobacterium kansasii 662]EUA14406.1 hypothetical protein I546_1468 [Mycobacterium kansasii 732]
MRYRFWRGGGLRRVAASADPGVDDGAAPALRRIGRALC